MRLKAHTGAFLNERVKGRICAKLVNRTKNAHLIEGAPHRDFLDLTVVYYVFLEQFEGVTSILIRNDMLTRWNVDEEEIYTHAMENSPELLPVSFMSIGDVIKSMIESGTVADETFESANNLIRIAYVYDMMSGSKGIIFLSSCHNAQINAFRTRSRLNGLARVT